MIGRFLALIFAAWVIGFMWFAAALPQPAADQQTDAVIVPTGAAGRIAKGLEIVRTEQAQFLLVTGVDPEVRPAEFAAEFGASMALMQCCVTLGFEAVDTRSNATETADWVKQNTIRSLRLVTSDWHMRRAAGELRYVLPTNIRVVEDAVRTEPSFFTLFLEYHKFVVSWATHLVPD